MLHEQLAPSGAPVEPWLSFLKDLDDRLTEETTLHCLGGFAVVQAYGLERATADIDVIAVLPYGTASQLMEHAGKESPLCAKHGIYLDVVTVASVPESYESRLSPLYPDCWRHLRLFVLEPHDLALTKLERNFERDRGDVEHLARSGYLKASVLQERYDEEMRPYVIGRVSWHDQTLQMWIEAYLSPDAPSTLPG
ncbi:MAG: DUF6036 family nucleotidyltransferase [Acidobacteria bacterium]|nr:DUF6036 family nucleotidyltransferase [Acidobacteriota bacterium]